jgi:hypothetical protein
MKKIVALVRRNIVLSGLVIIILMSSVSLSNAQSANPVEGRWDITMDMNGKQIPSWLEVTHSGRKTLIGRFVYAFGSARPVAKVSLTDGKYSFAIPPQWEPGERDMEFEFTVDGDKLAGTMVYTDGKKYNWTGVRAPALRREKAPVWDKPVTLFNGKDLKGWHAEGENQWVVTNGILTSPKSGSNLVSDQSFTDFKLHVEFRYQKGSNSGIYLRGRYEVQIEDNKGKDPASTLFGGIYGFLVPSDMMAKDPGEWQSYDITLIGRMVTIEANGKMIISNQEIPGITGGAIDSKEGEPGPLLIQGDHGPVELRNIVITPAK